MYRLVMAVSCVALLCEASLNSAGVIDTSDVNCTEVYQCQGLISMTSIDAMKSDLFFKPEGEYTQICQEYQKYKQCFEERSTRCGDRGLLELVQYIIADADKKCDPEVKEFFFGRGYCTTAEFHRNKVAKLMVNCDQAFNDQLELAANNKVMGSGEAPGTTDVCPSLEQLKTCVVSGVKDTCVDSEIVIELWNLKHEHQFHHYGCQL